jgi:hypothetical protein
MLRSNDIPRLYAHLSDRFYLIHLILLDFTTLDAMGQRGIPRGALLERVYGLRVP